MLRLKLNCLLLLTTVYFIGVSGGFGIAPPRVYTGNIGENPLAFVEGRILVKFHQRIDNSRARAIARAAGARLEREAYGKAFHIGSVPAGAISRVLEALNRNPNVEFAHADWIAYASVVPNDPLYSPYQWHLDNPVYGGIEMEEAWNLSPGGSSSVIVAVLDTGIAYENYGIYCQAPDLAGASFIAGKDFINNDLHSNDDASHGTHVAGTIAQSTNNGIGTAGVAYNITLMPVKVLGSSGSGSISAIAQGIRWATDNGAHIINMSLGTSTNPRLLGALEDAVVYASANGVLIIAAAGNSGRNKLDYPAGFAEVVAVAATRYNETLASYSNRGKGLELCAPGGDDGDLNGDGYPDMVLQQTLNPNTLDVCDFGYWFFSGTSMAAPHVAGAAALLFSAGVGDAATVRQILSDTADDLGSAGYDTTYGNGLINVAKALQSLGPIDEPPSVTITQPADGATVSGNVAIMADATDNDPLSKVEFLINGVPFGEDTDGTNGWSILWNTLTGADGQYELVASTTDSVGQTAGDLILVSVDNVDDPPTVALVTPQAGDTVSGIVLVAADAGDDGSVDQVAFYINGIPLSVDSDGSDGWSADWDTAGYTDGSSHAVSAIATDNVSQTAQDSVTVTVDNTTPVSSHVGDIDAVFINEGPTWSTRITVTVHDGSHLPIAGADVDSTWSGGASGSQSGTTDGVGQVTFQSPSIPKRNGTITLTVDYVDSASVYDPSLNHDPDGGSNGTTITVNK